MDGSCVALLMALINPNHHAFFLVRGVSLMRKGEDGTSMLVLTDSTGLVHRGKPTFN